MAGPYDRTSELSGTITNDCDPAEPADGVSAASIVALSVSSAGTAGGIVDFSLLEAPVDVVLDRSKVISILSVSLQLRH